MRDTLLGLEGSFVNPFLNILLMLVLVLRSHVRVPHLGIKRQFMCPKLLEEYAYDKAPNPKALANNVHQVPYTVLLAWCFIVLRNHAAGNNAAESIQVSNRGLQLLATDLFYNVSLL